MDSDRELDALNRGVSLLIKPVPFKGIDDFFDISGLLAAPGLFQVVVDGMVKRVSHGQPTVICALDARGFLLGSPIALALKVPLVMIRKHGRLPGKCVHTAFNEEYETGDVFEIQEGAIQPGDRVVVIDDILATGGSMLAAFELVKKLGAGHVGGACLMDLHLPGSREILKTHGINVWSLLDVSTWKHHEADHAPSPRIVRI